MAMSRHIKRAPQMTILQGLARSKPVIRLLMGLCLGIALSLVVAPFFEDQCASLYDESAAKKSDGYDRVDTDEYEPEIKTIPPTKEDSDGRQEQGGKQARIIRPRYLSTELGIKEKLFISVLTDVQSIETRGVAVNKTMNHLVQKLTFFMNSHSAALPQGLPVVSFSNNRSHMVPFHAIRYIADHYLNTYDWFYFFTDSTYVRGESLVEFVQHVSVAQNLMIGKPIETENDRISTCDLGAGILLSQSVMAYVAQQLDWCIRNAIPDGSNAQNMRTCLTRAAEGLNITCMDTINELTYSYFTSSSLDLSTALPENQIPLISKAIAVGTVKREEDFYWLHRFLCENEMKTIREQLENVKEEIVKVAPLTPDGNKSLVWPIGN